MRKFLLPVDILQLTSMLSIKAGFNYEYSKLCDFS